METDVSNVLSDLKSLSDNADQIILDSNFGNVQVGQWFSIFKETAVAIVKGTYCRESTVKEKSQTFSKEDIPSLVTLIKGKQDSHRVSTLLAEVNKDNRVRLSHRKPRKSLRKIVLGKKSGNQWKVTNRKSSIKNKQGDDDQSITPIPKIKDKLLESGFNKTFDSSTNKDGHGKSYLPEFDSSAVKTSQSDFITPIHQSKEIIVPDTCETTPVTRSKVNLAGGATEVVKVGKKNISFSSHKKKSTTLIDCDTSESTPSQLVNGNSNVVKDGEESQFLTPENKTTIDSDNSTEKSNYVTPITRSKRKSSIQLTQKNAKKTKSTTTSVTKILSEKSSKWDDNLRKNAYKKAKLAKDVNPVIPGIVLQQSNQIQPEKRILREIQKKEEKVSQNARKLQSLQKKKIEENKKAREKKMEKAMQQRMKIEKEKEERIRSRTQSKQENLQQTQSESKKGTQKKAERVSANKNTYKLQQEGKLEPPQKPLRSPVKKVTAELKSPKNKNLEVNKTTNHHNPSSQEITNTNLLNNLNATYVRSPADVPNSSTPPPKPIRNLKKPDEISSEKRHDAIKTVEFSAKADVPLSSTPSSKKIESKINLTKTPVSNKAKRPNSYAMTPHENSYVSYDISEIKSDDSDEEETVNQKPLPTWAFGTNLRNALLKQHYASIDMDDLFGNYFEPPVLAKIMGMEKKHYNKRTSSAIWLESPNRSRSYQT